MHVHKYFINIPSLKASDGERHNNKNYFHYNKNDDVRQKRQNIIYIAASDCM
jgi:hypothetical protein